MGDHIVNNESKGELRSDLIRHLLNDIEALEHMLREGMIEDDIIRIGAEQEFCLVNDNWRDMDAKAAFNPGLDSFTT